MMELRTLQDYYDNQLEGDLMDILVWRHLAPWRTGIGESAQIFEVNGDYVLYICLETDIMSRSTKVSGSPRTAIHVTVMSDKSWSWKPPPICTAKDERNSSHTYHCTYVGVATCVHTKCPRRSAQRTPPDGQYPPENQHCFRVCPFRRPPSVCDHFAGFCS